MDIIIRAEKPEDISQIYDLNIRAFGQDAEANLVNTLRQNDAVILSVVAVDNNRIVGHILFSPASIDSAEDSYPVAALAPMAVAPEFQRKGIGSQMVEESLAQLRKAGYRSVVVLGHQDYYPRFGFTTAKTRNIEFPYDAPDEACMVLELEKGCLENISGMVRFQPEFDALS